MNGPLSISLVVPAFNEEARIASTLETLCEHLHQRSWDWEIRVVDDGSTDRTASIAASFAVDEPRLVVQREPHRGKGGAVRAGMLAACGWYRFMCDADLSMPISELKWFLPPLCGDYDVAIASREQAGSRRIGEPYSRHLVGRLFNFVVQQLVLPGIEDSQCGFKMFTASAVDAIFPYVTTNGWAFDVEALAIARARELRIVEVPIEWHYREQSRLQIGRDGLSMLRELFAIRARSRGVVRPRDESRPSVNR
jgi:glycosyltransferase involved in cell wall biosynthesis